MKRRRQRGAYHCIAARRSCDGTGSQVRRFPFTLLSGGTLGAGRNKDRRKAGAFVGGSAATLPPAAVLPSLITRDRILGKCLFFSLRSYRPISIYEHELEVKDGFYGGFIVPINAYFGCWCLNSDKCL